MIITTLPISIVLKLNTKQAKQVVGDYIENIKEEREAILKDRVGMESARNEVYKNMLQTGLIVTDSNDCIVNSRGLILHKIKTHNSLKLRLPSIMCAQSVIVPPYNKSIMKHILYDTTIDTKRGDNIEQSFLELLADSNRDEIKTGEVIEYVTGRLIARMVKISVMLPIVVSGVDTDKVNRSHYPRTAIVQPARRNNPDQLEDYTADLTHVVHAVKRDRIFNPNKKWLNELLVSAISYSSKGSYPYDNKSCNITTIELMPPRNINLLNPKKRDVEMSIVCTPMITETTASSILDGVNRQMYWATRKDTRKTNVCMRKVIYPGLRTEKKRSKK